MDHIFVLAENYSSAHYYAKELGLNRGQYRAIGSLDNIRGMRRCTAFIVPKADVREDYERLYHQMIFADFTMIFIDEDVLDIIDGIGYTAP